jgi:hypothetical protein
MKKRKKAKKTNLAKSLRRLPLTVAVLTACLAIGAITVVSRQLVTGKSANEPDRRSVNASPSGRKYVIVKIAGRDVQVDSQTGQVKPLTPQEAQQLAEGLRGMLNKSTEGLVQVRHADGSVSMDLDGRFQNVMVARTNEDGSLSQSCVDNPQAAASFFGIDPQLLGVESSATQSSNQPAHLSPAKNPIK